MMQDFFTLEYVLVVLLAVVLYLLYYVFTKDQEYSKNIRSVASVVENLNRELFYLKKKLKENEQIIKINSKNMSDDDIYQEIERSVYDMTKPISIGLQQMQDFVQTLESEIDSRVSSLESGVKQISIPSSVHGNDDGKIISLFKQGVPLETISRELHLSKAEVEFVLKINKIK